jgi:uncharacterized protein (DUF433 family)
MSESAPHPLSLEPAYTLAEAARILDASPSTLRTWLHGRSYPTHAGRRQASPLVTTPRRQGAPLSFLDLVEVHMLLTIRRGYGIPLKRLRAAMEYLRHLGEHRLPLARKSFFHDHQHLYLGKDEHLISLSEAGQHVAADIVQDGMRQVVYGNDGFAERFFPTLAHRHQHTIALVPVLAFGQPVIARRGVTVQAVVDRFAAGETVADLAEDLDLNNAEIEEALRWQTGHAA